MVPVQFPLWQSSYKCSVALITQRWGIPNSFSKIHLTFLNSVLRSQDASVENANDQAHSMHLSIKNFAFRFHHGWPQKENNSRLVYSEDKSPLSQISSKLPCSYTHHIQLLVITGTFSQQLCCQHLLLRGWPFSLAAEVPPSSSPALQHSNSSPWSGTVCKLAGSTRQLIVQAINKDTIDLWVCICEERPSN